MTKQTDRAPIDIALEFVREQSAGEWDDATIQSDAEKLAALLKAEREVSAALLAALEALVDTSHGGTRGVQARDSRAVAACAAIAKAKGVA